MKPPVSVRGGGFAALLLLALAGASQAAAPAPTPVDLVISDALVVDGTGAAPRRADVAIGGGRILFVGSVPENAPAARRIDAAGRVLAPGFIDPHSHGDPFATPAFENFLAMGVTTITLGQDGESPRSGPGSEGGDYPAAWLAAVGRAGLGPNLALFVGHGTLREQAGIGLDPVPDPARMADLLARLDRALDVSFGLSTGLEYNPGMQAGSAELNALARVVGGRDRLIMSHLRNEDDPALAGALDELFEQGRFARVHVAHLKSVYGKGAPRAEEILGLLAAARADGIQVSADVYPYTASYTGIGLLFPDWARTAAQFRQAAASRDQELADYLYRRVMARGGPQATLLGTAPYTGQTLAEAAAARGKPFQRLLIDDIGPDGASAAYFVMDDALQSALLADPDVAISSDGSPTGHHPRGHGTFARVIEEYVVQRGTLTLAEAVRKMTTLPAGILGIDDRGAVAVGQAADLVLFDPARVRATASYVEPLTLARGFDLVLVNGRIARADGRLGDGLHGRVLRPRWSPRAVDGDPQNVEVRSDFESSGGA